MDLDLPEPDVDRLEHEDPTERFAVQRCPHCGAVTAVALCFATAGCEVCPKLATTRAARVEKHVPRILEGLGLDD